jgi:hypothetical protein
LRAPFEDGSRGVIDEVVKRFGSLTAGQLSQLTHAHAAWKRIPIPGEINCALFFDDEPGANPAVLEHLQDVQDDRELVDRLWLTSR